LHGRATTSAIVQRPFVDVHAHETVRQLFVQAAAELKGVAHGFGIPSLRVDGNDYLAVHAASKWAIDRARQGYGPTLIEWVTYRVGAHSTSDDPSAYRPSDECTKWPLGDPIARLRDHLIAIGEWSVEQHAEAVSAADEAVRAAEAAAAEHGTLRSDRAASPADMFDHLFENPPAHILRQRQMLGY
jgi:2-oxoisovalerate dehydrogenase E1 component alpha subunit